MKKTELKISKAQTEFFEYRFKNKGAENRSNHNTWVGGQLINKVEKYRYLGWMVKVNEEIEEDVASVVSCDPDICNILLLRTCLHTVIL